MDRPPNAQTVNVSAEFRQMKNFNHIYNLTPRDLQLNVSMIKEKMKTVNDPHLPKVKKVTPVFPFQVKSCLHLLQEPCKKAKVVAIKSIRFAAQFIPNLGDNIDKVIHLSRDPRGIINSRHKSQAKPKNIPNVKKNLCDHMLADLRSTEKQSVQHPHLFFSLKYEDFAAETMNYAKRIYEFVGLVNNNATLKRVVALTHQGGDNGASSTGRKNSTATASAWRWKMAPEVIEIITEKCAEVLSQYGYAL